MSKTVVLIDDDPGDLDIMRAALKKVQPGYACISFLFAEEALWVLKYDLVKTPDFILIDLNMPVRNGKECLQELRKTGQYKTVPIILTSSSLHDLVRETLLQAGATYIVEKPTYSEWPETFRKIFDQDWS